MALVKCKECGKEISDKATTCIHCGYPVKKQNANNRLDSKNGKHKVITIVGICIGTLIASYFIIWLVIFFKSLLH